VLLFISNIVDNSAYETITSLLIFVTLGLAVISSFSVTAEVACIMLPVVLFLLIFGSCEAISRAQAWVTQVACDNEIRMNIDAAGCAY
jgi:hypothetical protein